MRVHGNEGRLGRRFAIVIGLAALGVMALGAQTAAAAPDVVQYGTEVTIAVDSGDLYHGEVHSKVRKCMEGRRVILFKVRPGPNRVLDTAPRTQLEGGPEDDTPRAPWGVVVGFPAEGQHGDVYAKVRREVHDEFVCRGDRSKTLTRPSEVDRSETLGVSGLGVPAALGAQTAAAVPTYGTHLTITADRGPLFHGFVDVRGGEDVRKCEVERRVVLFRQRPGPDAELGTDRSEPTNHHAGGWGVKVLRAQLGWRVYAKAKHKVRDRYVCLADRSETYTWG